VRVIHGKGTGALREGVHRLLEKLPMVASWQWPAGPQSGGWGATWVWLKPASPGPVDPPDPLAPPLPPEDPAGSA
jgi:DNA-nicking Smr family endonuclease